MRGNPPSPSSSDGACVTGPQRYSSCSALSVRCTPMSSPRYCAAASRAHGAGTISDALVATPSRSASYTPTFDGVARARGRRRHDDQDAVVGPIAEPFGQSCHGVGTLPAAHPDAAHDDHRPTPLVAGVGDRSPQLVDVGHVRWDRQELSRSPSRGEVEVDEQPVGRPVDVREQPVVAIAGLGVALEAHRGARRQQRLGVVGLPPCRSTAPACEDRRSRACRCR